MPPQFETFVVAACIGIYLPIHLARLISHASWYAIIIAFVSWAGFLYIWFANSWGYERETTMWVVGFVLMSNWLAVPIISHVLTEATRWLSYQSRN